MTSFLIGIRGRLKLIISLSALLAGVLGLVGYLIARETFPDALYDTFRLFLLDYVPPTTPGSPTDVDQTETNIPLEIARFLAPATTVTAAIAAVLVTLAKTADRFLSRQASNHTIICNPGKHGGTLARNLRDAGELVVVIASEADQGLIEDLRRERIPVIEGEPSEEHTLVGAGARRARRIIGLPTDGGGNFEIATALRNIPVEAERREVNLFSDDLALVDFLTSHSLQQQDFARGNLGDENIKERRGEVVEWGSLDRTTATLILAEYLNLNSLRERLRDEKGRERQTGGRAQTQGQDADGQGLPERTDDSSDPVFVGPADLPTIVVAGRSTVADATVLELAKRWWSFSRFENPEPAEERDIRLPVVLVNTEENSWVDHLLNVCPGIANSLRLEESRRSDAAVSRASGKGAPVVLVLNDDPTFLLRVLAELDALPPFPVNVVVCGDPAITDSLNDAGVFRSRAGLEVSVFDPSKRVYSADLISNTLIEQLAIVHHSIYEKNVFGLPASRPWPELDKETRDSNRQAVIHHISVKLPSENLTITPIGNQFTEESLFKFSQEQIERLAIIEHARWMEEKFADGWIFNPDLGDGQNKEKVPPEHGNLCPWEDLSETAKDKDRMFITGLPAILRAAGFRIVPVSAPDEADDRSA